MKIDGDFVRTLPSSLVDREMVKAILGLARGLGMCTVAEFVVSREVYDELAGLGVDLAQGYYLGRPEPLRALLTRAAAVPRIPLPRSAALSPVLRQL